MILTGFHPSAWLWLLLGAGVVLFTVLSYYLLQHAHERTLTMRNGFLPGGTLLVLGLLVEATTHGTFPGSYSVDNSQENRQRIESFYHAQVEEGNLDKNFRLTTADGKTYQECFIARDGEPTSHTLKAHITCAETQLQVPLSKSA